MILFVDICEGMKKTVLIWLYIGLIMVIGQIILGAITRLTESGLSITEWNVITGIFPPISSADWMSEFNLYKETPQFRKLNSHMTLADFKWIYFWEYFHRLWARLMGFVFFIPFIYFYINGYLNKALIKKLVVVIAVAALAAIFGWLMVVSGLRERPWVSAYKLSIHLSIGFALLVSLYWTIHDYKLGHRLTLKGTQLPAFHKVVTVVFVFQVIFGGLMSGMKAGLFYPTWPMMNGSIIPDALFNSELYEQMSWIEYDKNIMVPAIVQVLHRFTGYALFVVCAVSLGRQFLRNKHISLRKKNFFSFGVLIQVIIGIITVLSCRGEVPVFIGVVHQAAAVLLCLLLVDMIVEHKYKYRP